MPPRFTVIRAELSLHPFGYQYRYAIYVHDNMHPNRLPAILLFTDEVCRLADNKPLPPSAPLVDKLNFCQTINDLIYHELMGYDWADKRSLAGKLDDTYKRQSPVDFQREYLNMTPRDFPELDVFQEQIGLPLKDQFRDSEFKPIPSPLTTYASAIQYQTRINPDGTHESVPVPITIEFQTMRPTEPPPTGHQLASEARRNLASLQIAINTALKGTPKIYGAFPDTKKEPE